MGSLSAKDDPQVQAFFAPDAVQICPSEAPVSEWTIRAWCRAMGDLNPVYQDKAAALQYGHRDVFAPPVMMHSYTLPGLIDETDDNMQLKLRRRLTELGIISVVAVNYQQEYITPIRLGDRLTREVRFAAMSDEKVTALGVGHFVTMAEKVFNQNGDLIGNQTTRTLFFRPSGAKSRAANPPAVKAEEADASMGDRVALPPLTIPITTTLVVAAALASNDFEKVHHDRDFAIGQGLQDIIMNILTSSGLAIRFVTDWAGPAAVVRKIATQLKVPNNPGDVMTLTGWADRPFKSGEPTTVQVVGTNTKGTHMEIAITIS
jgi:acyl dehydratase